MSLVHDVLKEIDQRDGQSPPVPQAFLLPEESSSPVGWFIGTAALLALVVAVTAWWYFSDNAMEAAAVTDTQPVKENTAVVSPAFVTDAARTDTASTTGNTTGKSAEKKDDTRIGGLEENFPESQVATPIVKTIEEPGVIATAVSNTSTATINTSTATNSTSNVTAEAAAQQPQRAVIEGSHLEIHRRDQLHRERYMKTMKAMRAGNWQQAMFENEALLAAEGLTPELHKKALSNKLRIYLEQKRFAEFLEFYRQKHTQPEIQRSEIWLTTVAPGLHIVGAYKEAIDSYRLLSKLQPQVSNWPIAMALALEENQQADQARRVLSDLLQQYSLPTPQRQWVEQKLASLR